MHFFCRILDIDLGHGVFRAKFLYTLEWKDSRIEFKNLRKDSALNLLNEKEKSNIWIPMVVLDDVDLKNRFFHSKEDVTVIRSFDYRVSEFEDTHTTNYYSGR